ncbi:hypothetical protein Geob_0594 [Geotalea daltonii FRC-32]|uniref:Uncharacterized protein n=1 Tax=Geotalea daltonii (strain DSM 22248 / JCM 15807 / FRC-32) TaxID=316067 RepID=B9M0C3_GEODF|nr:hypothetical protein [Geotalea daltonii]ACM18960.1 hypothetical protein Geob_0594 [Geotalea daltonii FRC-32]
METIAEIVQGASTEHETDEFERWLEKLRADGIKREAEHENFLSDITLRKLQNSTEEERRDQSFFTAKVDNKFFVADKNIISIWQIIGEGQVEYETVKYWSEIDDLPFADTSGIFAIRYALPDEVHDFHQKIEAISVLYTLASRTLFEFDKRMWSNQVRLRNRDFERLAHELIEQLLAPIPPGYEKTREYRENEIQEATHEKEMDDFMDVYVNCRSLRRTGFRIFDWEVLAD